MNYRRKDKNVRRIDRAGTSINVTPIVENEGKRGNVPVYIQRSEKGVEIRKECYQNFDFFFGSFCHEIRALKTTIAEKDRLFQLCGKLIQQNNELVSSLIQEKVHFDCSNILEDCNKYVSQKIQQFATNKKRMALTKQNQLYVEPETKVIGLKWKTMTNPNEEIPDHRLVQATFQYVSIKKKIKALFSDTTFSSKYFDYNQRQKHKCKEGVFNDFCCGSLYQKSDFFRNNPNVIQIELSSDDFEVCSPLKSKATIHKMCSVYFRIRNMPLDYNSKLDSIHLVALCPSAYLKADDRSFQDIAEHVVNELKELETIGVEVSSGNYIKAALVNTSHDNLGGNSILGYVECFVATNSCRLCECTREEIQKTFIEIPSKMRQKSDYNELIHQLENQDGSNVRGIKMFCVLNNLKFYHMMENRSVDLMHDMNEGKFSYQLISFVSFAIFYSNFGLHSIPGVIPFFIEFFFSTIMQKKIASMDNIVQMVRDYNYGHLDKRNKPSLVKTGRKNVGQNASQSYCLMKYLPFIFWKFKDELAREWATMCQLLQIMTITYSIEMDDDDVKRLEELIEGHLYRLAMVHLVTLFFKHHLLTHYPNCIRTSGPVKHGWMMRYEAKNKNFTDHAHNLNNFINIAKSLAHRNQELSCKRMTFEPIINPSKKNKPFLQCKDFEKYRHHLVGLDLEKVLILNFLYYNSIEYRNGLMLSCKDKMFEIIFVLSIDSDYFVLCEEYSVKEFDFERNSIQIEKKVESPISSIFKISSSNSFLTYDKIYSEGNYFIIAETLDIYNIGTKNSS